MTGGVWFIYVMGFNLSVATGVDSLHLLALPLNLVS